MNKTNKKCALIAAALIGTLSLQAQAATTFVRSSAGLKAYQGEYDGIGKHKAFAQSALGIWAWAGGETTRESASDNALARCNLQVQANEPPCIVFDIDGELRADAITEEQTIAIRFADIYIDTMLQAASPRKEGLTRAMVERIMRLSHPPFAVADKSRIPFSRGLRELQDEHFQEAISALQTAAAGSPGTYQIFFLLSAALMGLDRDKEAEVALRRSIFLEPQNADSWLTFSLVKFKMGALDDAKRAMLVAVLSAQRPRISNADTMTPRKKDTDQVLAMIRNAATLETDTEFRKIYQAVLPEVETLAAWLKKPPADKNQWNEYGFIPKEDFLIEACGGRPRYPGNALMASEQGTITVTLVYDAEGKVIDTVLNQSSGYPWLDKATLLSVDKCRLPFPENGPRPDKNWTSAQYKWVLE